MTDEPILEVPVQVVTRGNDFLLCSDRREIAMRHMHWDGRLSVGTRSLLLLGALGAGSAITFAVEGHVGALPDLEAMTSVALAGLPFVLAALIGTAKTTTA